MALSDADRLKLAEIERRLEQDPTISRVFGRRRRMSWTLALAGLCAVLAYLACLVTVFLVTGSRVSLLLALPPVVVAVGLLRWPESPWLPVARRRHR